MKKTHNRTLMSKAMMWGCLSSLNYLNCIFLEILWFSKRTSQITAMVISLNMQRKCLNRSIVSNINSIPELYFCHNLKLPKHNDFLNSMLTLALGFYLKFMSLSCDPISRRLFHDPDHAMWLDHISPVFPENVALGW